MAVRYTSDQLLKAYLACRGTLLGYEEERLVDQKYDKPCGRKAFEEDKLLFILFCIEHLDHYDSDSDKELIISKANRLGKNAAGTVSDEDLEAFASTEKGTTIAAFI